MLHDRQGAVQNGGKSHLNHRPLSSGALWHSVLFWRETGKCDVLKHFHHINRQQNMNSLSYTILSPSQDLVFTGRQITPASWNVFFFLSLTALIFSWTSQFVLFWCIVFCLWIWACECFLSSSGKSCRYPRFPPELPSAILNACLSSLSQWLNLWSFRVEGYTGNGILPVFIYVWPLWVLHRRRRNHEKESTEMFSCELMQTWGLVGSW